MLEHHSLEHKSIRKIRGATADWRSIVKECVCFANARGGTLLIGIEDGSEEPPPDQVVTKQEAANVFKRVTQATVNVVIPPPTVQTALNGGMYLRVDVPPSPNVAATADGRYSIRVADECRPVLPENLERLVAEKGASAWEVRRTTAHLSDAEAERVERFVRQIRTSDRVKPFVEAKSDGEILAHYSLTDGRYLTQLGVLWVGPREARASLVNAPVVQYLRYDERGQRVAKEVWDDHTHNPREILGAVESLAVWRESVDVPSGLFRESVPIYDLEVVRELTANALVHRMYTTGGDVRIELYPDRLEVTSPGPLPLGITRRNILHKSFRRNEHLARVFHDLKLMEREGSGYDRLYQIQLQAGKPVPEVFESDDSVRVVVRGRDLNVDALRVVERASSSFALSSKEVISLGVLARGGALRAADLADRLDLPDASVAREWLGELVVQGVVVSKGRGRGTYYSVHPELLRASGYRARTTLRTIESHRLKELVLADVERYPGSAISDIVERIGSEIPLPRVRSALRALIQDGLIEMTGSRRWSRYSPTRTRGEAL